MPTTYVFTVGGVARHWKSGSLEIDATSDGVTVLSCEIVSTDASVRPTLDQVVTLSENGTPIFGGYIATAHEMGAGNQPIVPIVTRISCRDYSDYANRIHPNITLIADTLKNQLIQLQVYRTPFGTTLDGAQANGPTLPQTVYAYDKTLTQVYADLAVLSGYLPRTDPANVFRMIAPGDISCAFNIAPGDGNAVGDVQVEPTRDDQYANRVVVPGQAQLQPARVDTFTGDGTTSTFPLGAVASGPEAFTGGVWFDDGVNSPVFETLGATAATWIWDLTASPQTIHDTGAGTSGYRVSPPAAGTTIRIIYAGTFSGTAIAEDIPSQAPPTGIWEVVLPRTDVVDQATLQAYADAELARRLVTQRIVTYQTYALGAAPGLTQTVEVTERNVNDTFLIQSVRTSDPARADLALLRTVTAIVNPLLRATARDTVQQWSQDAGGQAAPQITSPGGPATPIRSAQFNRAGEFGGTADVLIDEDGSGDNYGVEVFPCTVAVASDDARGGQFAIWNTTAGRDKALTIWQQNDADTYVEFDGNGSGGDLNIFAYGVGTDLNISSPRSLQIVDGGYPAITGGLSYVGLRHLVGVDTLLPGAVRQTSSFTIDSAFAGGGRPECVIYLDKTTSATVTLPVTTADTISVGATDGYNRILFFKNINTGVWALTPASGTIEGASSYNVAQNQAVIIGASVSTGAGWHVLASFGIPTSSGPGSGDVVGPSGATSGDLALFDGSTGKLIKDGSIDTDLLFTGTVLSTQAGVRRVRVPLTNTQVKALGHPTSVTLVPAPGTGFRIVWLQTDIRTNLAVAYGGVDAAAYLVLAFGTDEVSNYIGNDATTDLVLTGATDLLTTNAISSVQLVPFTQTTTPSSAEWGNIAEVKADIYEDTSLVLKMNNQGGGDLSGGDAANQFVVTVYYAIQPL